MGRGKHYNEEVRDMALRILAYFEHEKRTKPKNMPASYFNQLFKRAEKATGVSELTLRNIRSEAKKIRAEAAAAGTTEDLDFNKPKKRKPRKKFVIDDAMIEGIRKIVDDFKHKNEVVTLRKVLAIAKAELDFPAQRGTLWKIIKEKLGYNFKDSLHKGTSKASRKRVKKSKDTLEKLDKFEMSPERLSESSDSSVRDEEIIKAVANIASLPYGSIEDDSYLVWIAE